MTKAAEEMLHEFAVGVGAANMDNSIILPGARAPEPEEINGWPNPAPEAFRGLAGEFVKVVSPHTEADDFALLAQFLVMFGNAAGRASYFPVEADKHTTNINVILVGETAAGRKGTAYSQVRRAFEAAEPQWAATQISQGLSSGEGLIWAVRDPIARKDPIKEHGKVISYESVVADHGVEDKRLLVVESEFSSPLKVAEREGNTLTGIIRQAWDTGSLRVMTKTNSARSTGAHISIIGHITQNELLRCLSTTELANGFANRFLWVCSRRSKELPDGGCLPEHALEPIISQLQRALEYGKRGGVAQRDGEAREIWHKVYGDLSSRKPGLLGAVLSRVEAQVTRVSLLYSLLDCSLTVRGEHLESALAFWEYVEASVRCIFGDTIGDPVADTILDALRAAPEGLTRTEISALFSRHQDKQRIEAALKSLRRQNLAQPKIEDSGGRPVEKWAAVRLSRQERTNGH